MADADVVEGELMPVAKRADVMFANTPAAHDWLLSNLDLMDQPDFDGNSFVAETDRMADVVRRMVKDGLTVEAYGGFPILDSGGG